MKSIIIGTAGHIDHGKTALVKALTGIDADRLQEEKRRGITIDLGFAHLELTNSKGEAIRFGFVDVPGHERFVRNMLAGVGGIDLVLLVIAADEGIKPQTREHFDICRLLGIQHGITVLTKSDLVDGDGLEVIKLEVKDFLRGSFLETAPILPVSSLRRAGLEELKRELVQTANSTPARSSDALTRLPIDRVFTMKGFGTVVTGTLVSGSIRKEDELELFPARKKVRVRGVQVHGAVSDRAVAGERTALNLAGIEKDELGRGMMLAAPHIFETSSRFDVQLSSLSSAKPIKQGARVHFHAFTSESIATVTPYESKEIAPGSNAFAQLRLSSPALLFPGDRFIIRQFSPVITIGGGVILDGFPQKKQATDLDFLNVLANQSHTANLLARVSRRGPEGLSLSAAAAETGWNLDYIGSLADSMPKDILRLGEVLASTLAFGQIYRGIQAELEKFHAQNPLAPGMPIENLRATRTCSRALLDFTWDCLLRARKIEFVPLSLVRLSGRSILMKDEEAQSRDIIEQAFASAGLRVPALNDVLAGLKIDKTRAQKIVTLLLRDKVLVKVSEDLVFHQSALAQLRKLLAAQKLRSARLDVGGFKELTGVSRKYAIPLLEYLDRERLTKRVGDSRVIL